MLLKKMEWLNLFLDHTSGASGFNPKTSIRWTALPTSRGYVVRYTGREAVYCTDPGSQPGNCNPNLNDGEILDSQQYPVVWQNGEYVY